MNDEQRLALIVELIDLTCDDLATTDRPGFDGDRRLIDATAHRIMHIGENAMRLSANLREGHPDLPWREIAGMRNYIAHEYQKTSVPMLWQAVNHELDELRAMCATELAENADGQGE